jgi:hypothetical protein
MRGKDLMLSYHFRVLSNNMNDFWGMKAGGLDTHVLFVCVFGPLRRWVLSIYGRASMVYDKIKTGGLNHTDN